MYRLHEKLGIAAATAMTHIATIRAWAWSRHLTAAKLLPGEVTAHAPRAPGGAGHGGGEVNWLLHIRAVRAQHEMLRVNGIL